MFVTLRKGTCIALLDDQPIKSGYVQVLTIEEADVDEKGRKKYLVEITDGFNSIPAMLGGRLSALVSMGKIDVHSVIEIAEHVRRKVCGLRLVTIQSIHSLWLAGPLSHDVVPLDVAEDAEKGLSEVLHYIAHRSLITETPSDAGNVAPPSCFDGVSQGSTDRGSSGSSAAVDSVGSAVHYLRDNWEDEGKVPSEILI